MNNPATQADLGFYIILTTLLIGLMTFGTAVYMSRIDEKVSRIEVKVDVLKKEAAR